MAGRVEGENIVLWLQTFALLMRSGGRARSSLCLYYLSFWKHLCYRKWFTFSFFKIRFLLKVLRLLSAILVRVSIAVKTACLIKDNI